MIGKAQFTHTMTGLSEMDGSQAGSNASLEKKMMKYTKYLQDLLHKGTPSSLTR
jgi:hypothetical protein